MIKEEITVALIQARMGSRRLPGKMMALLGGVPLLEWVVRRLQRAASVSQVVLTTSNNPEDDELVQLARRLGIAVFRGSEADVLGRLAGAAKMARADSVVRICADNPFVDPGEVDRLVDYFAKNPCDYACNHQDRLGSSYADGFGAEILSVALLEKIAAQAIESRYREHATLYLWDHANHYRLRAPAAPAALAFPELRFDVDTLDDLENLATLVRAGVGIDTAASEIVRIARVINRPDDAGFLSSVAEEIDAYLKRLFPLCRSITGEPNRQTLRILQEIIPLTIHEVPTDTAVYDWTIPNEWTLRDAWIADATGRRLVDFQISNLHVVSYSEPVNAVMDWTQLRSHIHRHPELPEAIPYRTTYFKRDWGFCVTHAQYAELEQYSGPFTVVIDSDFKPGTLSYGEVLLRGRSSREILLSCYICHPSMANDNLSGVLLTSFLARYIAGLKDRHWSYRIVFVPETIGAIAYCSLNEAALKQIDTGVVITTVGGPGKFGYKQSFDPAHPINAMIEAVLTEAGVEFITYPFDIHGSDERQYSSQGFRINTATLCRDRYYEYPYYHSSLDDLSFVTGRQIAETLVLYMRLIQKLEARQMYRNRIPNCEVMLSHHDLYPAIGGAQLPGSDGRSQLDLILWLLFLCDGKLDLESIANRIRVSAETLAPLAQRLVKKGVLEHV